MESIPQAGHTGQLDARASNSTKRNLSEPLLAIDVLDRRRARAIGDEVRNMIDDAAMRTHPRNFARTVYKRLGDLPAIERVELPGIISVRVPAASDLLSRQANSTAMLPRGLSRIGAVAIDLSH